MNNKKIFAGNWAVNQGDVFFQTCVNIVNDNNLFASFKTNPIFCVFIGNDVRTKQQSEKFLENILPSILKDIEKYRTNDLIGNPPLHYFEGLGKVSSGTLYFLSILSRILNNFDNLNTYRICEIGSGYGGQAKIILDYGVSQYTCIDDFRTLSLAKKYLDFFKYPNVEFKTIKEIDDNQYDLVISNWCLSEFDDEGIDFYLNTIIKNSKNAYFEMNMEDYSRKYNLINKLKNIFSEVTETTEVVKTGTPPNFLLICKNNIIINGNEQHG